MNRGTGLYLLFLAACGGGTPPVDGGPSGEDDSGTIATDSGRTRDGGALDGAARDAGDSGAMDGGDNQDGGPAGPMRLPASVAAAQRTSQLINASGELEGFGAAEQGRLGNGTVPQTRGGIGLVADAHAPVGIRRAEDPAIVFTRVRAGRLSFLALADDGKLYGWGSNADGQLGLGAGTMSVSSPTEILTDVVDFDANEDVSIALTADGTVYQFGRGLGPTPTAVPMPEGVAVHSVVAGWRHALVLTREGQVWGWGDNSRGQLGPGARSWPTPTQITEAGEPFDDVVSLTAGLDFNLALDRDGRLWSWGNNGSRTTGGRGALGLGQVSGVVQEPTPITSDATFVSMTAGHVHAFAIDDAGQLYGWGDADSRQLIAAATECSNRCLTTPTPVASSLRFAEVAAGSTHALARALDGAYYAWGSNREGELGIGFRFVDIPERFQTDPIRVDRAGALRRVVAAWGENNVTRPVTTFKLDDGSVWFVGNAGPSGSAAGSASPSRFADEFGGAEVVDFCSGETHSLVALDNGEVRVRGLGTRGELGLGEVTTAATWTPVPFPGGTLIDEVRCGPSNSYAIDRDRGGWAWGSDNAGQLGDGLGSNDDVPSPTRIASIDDSGGFLGPILDLQVSRGPGGSPFVVAIIQGSGAVVTWGDARAFNSPFPLSRPSIHNCNAGGCSAWPRRICTDMATEFTDCDDGATFLNGATAVAVAQETAVVAVGSTIYTWGSAGYGLIGDDSSERTDIAYAHQVFLSVTPVALASSNQTFYALTADGDVYAWGDNRQGQLGLGDNSDSTCIAGSCRTTPTLIEALDDITVVNISGGDRHAVAVDDMGRLWTWGRNGAGELGHLANDLLGGGRTGSLAPTPVILIPR